MGFVVKLTTIINILNIKVSAIATPNIKKKKIGRSLDNFIELHKHLTKTFHSFIHFSCIFNTKSLKLACVWVPSLLLYLNSFIAPVLNFPKLKMIEVDLIISSLKYAHSIE